MTGRRFIQVILPLRLEWEPFYSLPEGVSVKEGSRVRVRLAGREYPAVVSRTDAVPDVDTKRIQDISCVEEELDAITAKELDFWRFLSSYYMCSVGEVFAAAYPVGRLADERTAAAVKQRQEEARKKALAREEARRAKIESRILARKERLDKSRKEEVKERLRNEILQLTSQLEGREENLPQEAPEAEAEISLTPLQRQAAEDIQSAFSKGKNVLLKGVTGSGKTEVYLSVAKEVMSQGRNVLFLAPEIAMSMQLASRIDSVFPGKFFIFNSSESFASRRRVTEGISRGQYIVLGTRSALLLPHRDLGLIIVDEEHDSSYKQDSPAPRYNGRDSALMLAKIHNCPVILGSATPSLESLYNCRTGKFEMVTLPSKYYGGKESGIEIIDSRAEARKNGMVGNFSRKLIAIMNDTLGQGGQIMILRARRAYSPAVQCMECGEIVRCPSCNVALSYHHDRHTLQCHYCGHTETFTGKCPRCGGELSPIGAGTQKIEEEVQNLFPAARTGRLDGDMSKVQVKAAIDAFENGATDILIGTQMLAKGFDFQNVALAVMIQADSLLALEDFRADEKALQLLVQLRGRSGRRGKQSRFVIQTSQPDHPVYRMLIEGGSPSESQFSERKDFHYPPFTRVIVLTVKDTDCQRVETLSRGLAAELAAKVPGIEISGPYAPAVDRISNVYIRHIRLTLRRDASLAPYKRRIAEVLSGRTFQGKVYADVDPA